MRGGLVKAVNRKKIQNKCDFQMGKVKNLNYLKFIFNNKFHSTPLTSYRLVRNERRFLYSAVEKYLQTIQNLLKG